MYNKYCEEQPDDDALLLSISNLSDGIDWLEYPITLRLFN